MPTFVRPNSLMAPNMPAELMSSFEGMVFRCRVDEAWTMEFVSAGCHAVTGYAITDFLAGGCMTLESLVHPEDRKAVRETVHAALEADPRYSVEYRIVRRDGAVRWVREHGSGLKEASDGPYVALEGFIQDITQHKESEQALHEAERRYRSIFENAVEGIFQSTVDRGYLAVNPALARIYGYATPEEMIADLRDIDHQLYVQPHRRTEFIGEMNRRGQVRNFESQVRRRDGAVIWISENARAVRDAGGNILFYEGTVTEITERRAYEEKIQYQATHDALTGLPNRNLLHDRLQQAVQQRQREGGIVAIALIDLDQFKFINDSLGHSVGDLFLQTVGMRLGACVRASDTVARQGGDEFIIVLRDKVQESVTGTIRRIISAVAQPWVYKGMELQITCSVGISICPGDGEDAQVLLRNADSAMYQAKDLGRNNFKYFAAEMNRHASERLELFNNLRQALAAEEFTLQYQPKVDLSCGRVVGAEALLRWQSPTRGPVPPADFIPLAEESGMIIAIGEWALRTACAQNVAWQDAGYPPIPVSVNLSARQLMRDDVVTLVADVLQSTGLDPSCLELEITETVLMRDVEKSLSTLARLKQLGVCISIDDFGTGYSSLNYLKRFPVDTLKIDRSFVSDIAQEDGAAIVKAIISLAHILNLKVVGEGVETEEQNLFLAANGCDTVQGYFIGAPMSVAEFAREVLATESSRLTAICARTNCTR